MKPWAGGADSPAIASVSTKINPQLPFARHMLKCEAITLARGSAATSRGTHPRRCLHVSPPLSRVYPTTLHCSFGGVCILQSSTRSVLRADGPAWCACQSGPGIA